MLINRQKMETQLRYSLEDIQKGDLIYFNETPGKSNYDEYWEVYEIDFSTEDVLIKLNYLYEDRYNRIKCSEIRQLLSVNKLGYSG